MDNTFNTLKNYDDVFLRHIIASLLGELNKNIYFYNYLDENNIKKIHVPFLWSLAGQETFMTKEFFEDNLENCLAYGDYESVPRGVLQLGNISINAGEQTNKFVPTKIEREVNNQLRVVLLKTNFVPITLSFTCDILCNNMLEQLKVTESLINHISKDFQLFEVNFGGFYCQASFSIPQDFNHERPVDYQLSTKKEYKMTLDITVKSFLPCFEHGLNLTEISELIKDLDKRSKSVIGSIQIQTNEDGKLVATNAKPIIDFKQSIYNQDLKDHLFEESRNDNNNNS